ncbi:hypothetical protein WALSEDRAFT_69510 [Wallemia mellicola CBS 633.66]|uniref:PH domain-containing protein n=2 Tax=Wallemia mellicola TaxID=1708541 RepID=I4YA43_WALMC|nr:hypothetical protein WALSEDRAFT_69510 [Wallemia mellicola CBS 633.66]EIM20835.1 hypothetical protein WALSEDRAFT_69510 [Wallemia mellicola CBS 633.66]TIC43581.1 hypothetical protein E3Q08_02240 [Wallemia mellicola]TIC61966.1 hypothetical protein E3Q03_02502 [Wallemia mellicola]|eukprot:XP_006959097.1 hypothetical protein WALSEDRAFT_69510 [Wallemia mellicola CBS 633.66]
MTTNESLNAYAEIHKYPTRKQLNGNEYEDAPDTVLSTQSSSSSISTQRSSPSTALKDRVLCRLAWSKREDLPDLFDERASVKFTLDRCYKWEESIAIYRENQVVDIYSNHSIPFRRSKDVKYSLDMLSDDTTISLYSATDFTLCMRSPPPKHHIPRRVAGTNLVFLKFKTTSIAKTWLWTLWTIKNAKRLPKELDVKLPNLGAHMRFPLEGKVTAQEIVRKCRTYITKIDIRGITPEKSSQTKLALCWRRGKFGLEWLSERATSEELLVGCCMMQTQQFPRLEVRRMAFENASIRYDINNTIYPPKPVEGHLSRITLISQKRVKTYLSTHESLIFLLKSSTAALKPSHDSENDKLRCCKQIREAVGFIDMRHIVSIRRVYDHKLEHKDKYPAYLDDTLFNGNVHPDRDNKLEGDTGGEEIFASLSQSEKHELHHRRQFELELISGHFAKFEAPSVALCFEWIRSLGELCLYWNKRTRKDARLLMEISNCGLGAPNTANALNQTVLPTTNDEDETPRVEDPDAGGPLLSHLWNWTVLNNVKPIMKIGKCFMRKSFRGTWSEYILILTADGMLHRWNIAPLNPAKKSKKANEILNRKKSTISLHHTFVLTSDDMILVNSNQDEGTEPSRGYRTTSKRAAKAPDRLYDDGYIACESEPSELAFILWCRSKSKKSVESLDKKAEKFEIRTRSRLERDHWCWCLEVIIDKVSEQNNDLLRNVSGIS